jgi:pyruvate,water dikinase
VETNVSDKVVLWPSKRLTRGNADLIGPKAASLCTLRGLGMNVPACFFLTTVAFRRHLDANGLRRSTVALLDKLEAEPDKAKSALEEIRHLIVHGPLVDDLREQIATAYERLRTARVSVRSSATAEDLPGHSFAGQYETYLGIASLEDCLGAVKRCWASLWTERAYAYRRRNGIDHQRVEMAVIIQDLIRADASGVLFTLDPATGRPDRVVIESCFGLGEALVSGKVTPDSFHVGKKSRALLARTISAKTVEAVPDADGAIRDRTVPTERAATPSIDEPTARELAALAVRLERKLRAPQDIEWAVADGRIFLLQARPITTIKERSWEDRQVWTNVNFGEVAPDPMTPATRSFIEGFVDRVFGSIPRMLCVRAAPRQLCGFVAGRIYWNINAAIGMSRHLPGWDKIDMPAAFGGDSKELLSLRDMSDEDVPDFHGSLLKAILRLPLSLYELYTHRQKKGRPVLRRIEDTAQRLRDLDLASLSEAQITDRLYESLAELGRTMDILYAVTALGALPVLAFFMERWFRDMETPPLPKLLAGIQGMDSAQAGLDLWALAVEANRHVAVREAILSAQTWQDVRAGIEESQAGASFLAAYDEFMALHGHHCRGELELANPRWVETPDYILGQLQAYLKSIGRADPAQYYQQLIERRRQLKIECEQYLRNPLKRHLFRYLLASAQSGCVLRENFKSVTVRLITAMRKVLLDLGRRFHEQGLLEEPGDIFLLRLEELGPIAAGEVPRDLRRTIESRRAEYEENLTLHPPGLIFGKFDRNAPTPAPGDFDRNATTLTGMPVSPGIATGKARVILRADADQQVHAGEILVAPFTDPGWTPYFIPAVAIVMDQGGQLSHGSIIAREYGIPAIVNIPHATEIIKTGQTITVDAERGTVTILDGT